MNSFPRIRRSKSGITNAIFGGVVAVLVIVAAVGFGLFGTATGKTTTLVSTLTLTTVSTQTTEVMMNHTMTTTEVMAHTNSSNSMTNGSVALVFTPKSGAMISDAWLIAATIGMNECAVSIHAEGLEPNGTYIVEGSLAMGSMQTVPMSMEAMGMMNTTSASEFQANRNGTGQFWIVLSNSVVTSFEQIDLVYLPMMSMQNATVVATADTNGMMGSTMMTTTMMSP